VKFLSPPLFFPTTTASKPRCSSHTGLLLASFLMSGLRSEHSSSPRSTLAGSSVNHVATAHQKYSALSLILRSSSEGRLEFALLWDMLWEPGGALCVLLQGYAIRHRSHAHSSLSRILVLTLAHGGKQETFKWNGRRRRRRDSVLHHN